MSSAIFAAEKMEFRFDKPTVTGVIVREMFEGNRVRIYASGPVDYDAAERLRAFVEQKRVQSASVFFDSPGGSLIGGIKLGKAIRDLGFNTYIGKPPAIPDGPTYGICASACAYAFAGGVHRYFDDDKNKLGLHQFSFNDDSKENASDTQTISGLLISYLQNMGVDAYAFTVASTARSNQMQWLSKEESAKLRFSTNGKESTTAELKLMGPNAYLRLEQVTDLVTSRVLLVCEEGQLYLSGGIVTTPELSSAKAAGATRNYLEFDADEVLPMPGTQGMRVVDSVLWIDRPLSALQINKLIRADLIGTWTENGGNFRWGAFMDVSKVKGKIRDYASNCGKK